MKLRSAARRIRLLPLTLAAIAVALPLRMASVWDALSSPGRPMSLVEASAAEKPAAAAEPKPAEAKPDHAAESAPTTVAADPVQKLLPGDKIPLTQTEIDLLQKLQVRREALDARERELDMREAMLRAAEKTIETKATELTQLQQTIETMMGKHNEEEQKKLDNLVAIYEKMKPKDAARIFNDLQDELLVSVLGGMKENKIALVLAEMEGAKARAITTRMAERQPIGKPAQ